jgi:hypothetical protein
VLDHLYPLEDQDRLLLLHVHLGERDLELPNAEMIVLLQVQAQQLGDEGPLLLLLAIHPDEHLETHPADLHLTFTQAVWELPQL